MSATFISTHWNFMLHSRSMIDSDPAPIPTFAGALGDDRSGVAAALIVRMAKEDGSALTELHGMWSPVLLGIACRMLGDRREAEEAVQDTFVRMWHRSADYDPKQSPPFVWAFAVMRGYCIDRLRYRHRSKRDSSRVVPIHLHAAAGAGRVGRTRDGRAPLPGAGSFSGIHPLGNLSALGNPFGNGEEPPPPCIGKSPRSTFTP
jgi:hypothetical protein